MPPAIMKRRAIPINRMVVEWSEVPNAKRLSVPRNKTKTSNAKAPSP
jgi:hypothetical protein